jgi:hypothetical protein
VLLLRQLFDRVEALGPDHFSSLPEFLLFAADFLAGESRTDSGQKQNVDYPLALRFYELSLEGKSKGLPAAHSGLLKVMLRSRSFERAEQAVVRAVAEAGDDPAIVMTAAKVMQEMGRPAVARLLAGRAVELSPVKAASKDVSSGLAADSEQDWLNIELIHDTANAAKAGKLGSVEEWLAEAQSQRGVARRTANADTAEIVRLTGWLREFFELLGHHLPGQLVDLDHYRHRAGIWFQDMDEAILHYFEQGWKARISSHPAFDESCVRRQLQEHRIDSSSEPPALLFLRHERALGLAPNTLFDPAVYLSGLTESPERPWFHYLEGGWQQNPNISPYFDAVRFRDQVRRKPEDALLSPLMFFLTRNTFLDVNGLFHAGFYDSRYRDSVKDMAPLAHYLSEGVYLGYQPNPFFVPQGKTARERLDYLKIHSVV